MHSKWNSKDAKITTDTVTWKKEKKYFFLEWATKNIFSKVHFNVYSTKTVLKLHWTKSNMEESNKIMKYKVVKIIPVGIMSERPDTDADLMTERVFCLIIEEAGGIMIRPVAGGWFSWGDTLASVSSTGESSLWSSGITSHSVLMENLGKLSFGPCRLNFDTLNCLSLSRLSILVDKDFPFLFLKEEIRVTIFKLTINRNTKC